MAVTITQSPQTVTPSDNPVVWVFNSDQSAQTNFSFLIEVYVNGAVTPRSRHTIFPEYNEDTAHFDAEAEKITNVICSNPLPNLSAFSADAGNDATIYIKVIEVYGDPATQHASATSSTVTVFKSSLSDDNFNDYVYTDYVFSPSVTSKKFLTFFPRTERLEVATTEDHLFLMIAPFSVTLHVARIRLKSSTGSTIATDYINLSTGNFVLFDASPRSVIDNSAITLANFQAASYYEVTVLNALGTLSGETLTINLNDCNNYETKRLHFLNSLGGIDAFSFTKGNEKSRDITRFGMEKQLGQFDDSGNYVFNTNQGREIDYMTQSAGKLRITSDLINQGVQNWLADELYESPFILMEINAGEDLKRVKITNTSTVYKKNSQGNVMQEVVDLNTSDNRKSSLL